MPSQSHFVLDSKPVGPASDEGIYFEVTGDASELKKRHEGMTDSIPQSEDSRTTARVTVIDTQKNI